jgi:hypothetical protein
MTLFHVYSPACPNLVTGFFPNDAPSFHAAALYENASFAIALVFAGSFNEARRAEDDLVTNYKWNTNGKIESEDTTYLKFSMKILRQR